MSTLTAPVIETASTALAEPAPVVHRRRRLRRLLTPGRIVLHIVTIVFMLVWFTPVLGLFVSAVRTQADAASTGWWTAIVDPLFTGYNYQQAMGFISAGESLATSLAISLPTTVLTTVLSLIGAYSLTRMTFTGRTVISLLLVAMLVIPPQVTLVPMLKFFAAIGLQGTVPSVWIYQVGFTIPFGIFLIRGFIASIPEELFEAAAIDGASTFQTFRTIVTPLSLPVLASLAIMQFLWSWNDLLIPLLFLGGSDLEAPLTVQVAGLVQSNGEGEAVLMAATCLSILVPLIILIGMQRFFVRGVLGGAVKG
ncbi:carbohydrate ABC transporter permease [Rathayibacter sp. VKM Ac-2929]|uniref:carbohydrate ABC transporter permease n=1 Tax=Rathayibacter sp. VKM Ac-2929 TaxID=2929480 RepID=UPI001FB1A38C|nr:carbohydrate ABC transporter permease [Rathayibacter sp. VKM Ac-2929]MCJ1675511.1 carbohydrate ABC transporter permease [Rathayibacter sp. VKM Ac-2929]